MARARRAVAASAAFALLAGTLLWPPRAVYWTRVAAVVGEGVTLALVAAVAVSLGAGFARATGVRVRHAAAGGLAAYALGMVAIRVLIAPDSPAHLVSYAGLLILPAVSQYRYSPPRGGEYLETVTADSMTCLVAGVALWRRRFR